MEGYRYVNIIFSSSQATLKREFKDVFRNISRTLDCVSCQQCRLHGKLSLLGLGTALKILLLPAHVLQASLTSNELVAFFNTLASFSQVLLYFWFVFFCSEEEESEFVNLKSIIMNSKMT
jgi:hypothetical protein